MDQFQAKEGTTPLPMHDADSSKQKTAFLVKQKEKSLERISFVLVDNDYESKSSAATVARNRVTKSWNSTIEPTHRWFGSFKIDFISCSAYISSSVVLSHQILVQLEWVPSFDWAHDENVIRLWHEITADVALWQFLLCAQLEGGTYSFWTQIWGYRAPEDEIHFEWSGSSIRRLVTKEFRDFVSWEENMLELSINKCCSWPLIRKLNVWPIIFISLCRPCQFFHWYFPSSSGLYHLDVNVMCMQPCFSII